MTRYQKYERLLRRMRQRIFDYYDQGRGEQASRIIARCQEILAPMWRAERAAAEDARLQRTPSAYELGGTHVR